ncbi:hypothetical protein IAR55_000433 [Kwoniella newhampshirensis]|uniref:Man(5)GlcNAc(2)-PP-dolichol translocation protein RFT1 n=1 Tax=Kwoniella newhampshirensis TaxID=1651941 RepID=A0AAW0Z765_9TREE
MSKSSSTSSTSRSTSTSTNPLLTARSLVLLQLLSRFLTFGLNQTLLRLASPSVFGTAAIQFDLVFSSILFLSREGIRNALLRRSSSTAASAQEKQVQERQVHGLSVVPLQLGICIATLITSLYLTTSDITTTTQPSFHLSLTLYVLSALIELAIEPYYIRVHRSSPPRLNVRVQAEGGMAIVKAIVTVGSLVGLGEEKALLGFAIGQLAGAVWLASRYLREFKWDLGSLVWTPRPIGEPRFDPQMLSLATANTGQSVIKHLLTEADRITVARISPLNDQGGYAVAMNYGSLVARIIFQPLEESLHLHYSSSLASESTLTLFTATIRLALYLTLLVRTFVPPLFPAISPLLLPRQYHSTTAPDILRLYLTTYIPLLSLNGVAEAFHTASANPGEVKNQARWMVASSAVFATTLLFITSFPTLYVDGISINPSREEALVWASCAAMVVRIAYAIRHAKRFFVHRRPALRWLDLLPAGGVVVITCIFWVILKVLAGTNWWKTGWKGWAGLVGTGGLLGLTSLGTIFYYEKQRLQELRRSVKVQKVD